jgi:hypothetical protein
MKRETCATMLLVVALSLLAGVLVPSTAAQSILAPPMGDDIIISARENNEATPAVAYNWKHDEYLVVWQNIFGTWGEGDIRARRVTGHGVVTDEFTIATDPSSRAEPAVDYDPVNDRYLVVWSHYVGGGLSPSWDIAGRLVPWDGPDPNLKEFTICDWNGDQGHPAVAYGRTQEEFLAVWQSHPDAAAPWFIGGRRIKADGTTSPNSWIIANDSVDHYINPDVAYNLARNEYLVTWDAESWHHVYAVRLRGDGVELGGGKFWVHQYANCETTPAVAACETANQYLVVWNQCPPTGWDDIYGRFVDGVGVPDPAGEFEIHKTDSSEDEPDVACNAPEQKYLVVWEQGFTTLQPGIWGKEVWANKTTDWAFQIQSSTSTDMRETPALASGAPGPYLVAWSHTRGGGNYLMDIHGRLVGNTRPTASFTVSPASGDTSTQFRFDASGCTDAEDAPSALEVRWDWHNDGTYDTAWSTTKTATMIFNHPATVTVRLQVRDSGGLTHSTTRQVTVNPPSLIIRYYTHLPVILRNR